MLEVPIASLSDAERWDRGNIPQRGVVGRVPRFHWQEHVVWGASALILAELESLLRPFGVCSKESS